MLSRKEFLGLMLSPLVVPFIPKPDHIDFPNGQRFYFYDNCADLIDRYESLPYPYKDYADGRHWDGKFSRVDLEIANVRLSSPYGPVFTTEVSKRVK